MSKPFLQKLTQNSHIIHHHRKNRLWNRWKNVNILKLLKWTQSYLSTDALGEL